MGTNGNTLSSNTQTVHLAGPEDARLHFSGPPNNLTGLIPLINNGPEKQKIRSITVSAGKLLDVARLPLREIPFYARLYGGDQISVPATLVVDPQTPPGSYDLELTVGTRTMPATAHVLEFVNLRLDPAQITIVADGATSYTRKLLIQNEGNVALSIGPQWQTPLFDSVDLLRAFLNGLHNGDRQSAESMAKAFLNEWAELKVGTLVAKRKAMVLSPGQKVAVDVEFELPTDLKPFGHYRANLQLYNAILSFEIYTQAKTGPRSKAPHKK